MEAEPIQLVMEPDAESIFAQNLLTSIYEKCLLSTTQNSNELSDIIDTKVEAKVSLINLWYIGGRKATT